MDRIKYFFSYSRKDTDFVLRLAKELRAAGADLWLDQLDIVGGERWDRAIERALQTCDGMLAVISPDSLASENTMDEVSYALEKGRLVVPLLLRSAEIPFRLRRVQHIDFTKDYEAGFSRLVRAISTPRPASVPEGGAEESEPGYVGDWRAKAESTSQTPSPMIEQRTVLRTITTALAPIRVLASPAISAILSAGMHKLWSDSNLTHDWMLAIIVCFGFATSAVTGLDWRVTRIGIIGMLIGIAVATLETVEDTGPMLVACWFFALMAAIFGGLVKMALRDLADHFRKR